ncbi:hypothetical protein SAMN05216217_1277 [Halopseudomonas yangmingensis]|uniref:Uncharacterized protein n=2 Tax=Halopseudomonas yangmingensis TaxID=1720063 RepID=A0A1I4UN14_9GAMM|nr:hypothetical protein SAMN05216217_1277 [Halopseudomonas yangmingensis]
MTLNLKELLVRPGLKVVSVGCEDITSCSEVLGVALALALEEYNDGRTIVLPRFLPAPTIKDDESGFIFSYYEIENFWR